jgi:hypothetical protein
MTQGAIEWLAEQLKSRYDIDIERLSVTDQAKAMEEKQREEAYKDGKWEGYQDGKWDQKYNS